MNEFMMIFRADYQAIFEATGEEMQERNNRWMDWIDQLADNDHLAEGGNHLSPNGKVLRGQGASSDGPFRESKESVLGYILIYAANFDEAVELAKACPILAGKGTSVEVREIAGM